MCDCTNFYDLAKPYCNTPNTLPDRAFQGIISQNNKLFTPDLMTFQTLTKSIHPHSTPKPPVRCPKPNGAVKNVSQGVPLKKGLYMQSIAWPTPYHDQ